MFLAEVTGTFWAGVFTNTFLTKKGTDEVFGDKEMKTSSK